MKKLILLSAICLIANAVSAQTKYGFAYSFNSEKKLLYISRPINLANYSNCKDNNGYNTTVNVNICLQDAYYKSVKIEAGSSYSKFSTKVITSKNEYNTYNDKDAYTSESEVNDEIKNVMAKYRSLDYSVLRVEP